HKLLIEFHLISSENQAVIRYRLSLPNLDVIRAKKGTQAINIKTSINGSDSWPEMSATYDLFFEQVNGLVLEYLSRKHFKIQDVYKDALNSYSIIFSSELSHHEPSKLLELGIMPSRFGEITPTYKAFVISNTDTYTPFFISTLPLFQVRERFSGEMKVHELFKPASLFVFDDDLSLTRVLRENCDLETLYVPEDFDRLKIPSLSEDLPSVISFKHYPRVKSVFEFLNGLELDEKFIPSNFDSIVLVPDDPRLLYYVAPFIKYVNGYPIIASSIDAKAEYILVRSYINNPMIYSIGQLSKKFEFIIEKEKNVKIFGGKTKSTVPKIIYEIAEELLIQIAADHTLYRYSVLNKKNQLKKNVGTSLILVDDLTNLLKKKGLYENIIAISSEKGFDLSQKEMDEIYRSFPKEAIKYALPSLKHFHGEVPGSFDEEPPSIHPYNNYCRVVLVEENITIRSLILASHQACTRICPILIIPATNKKQKKLLIELNRETMGNMAGVKDKNQATAYFMSYSQRVKEILAPQITRKIRSFLSHYDLVPAISSAVNKSRIITKKNAIPIKKALKSLYSQKGDMLFYLKNNEVPMEIAIRENVFTPEWAIGRMTTGNDENDFTLHVTGIFQGQKWSNLPKWLITSSASEIHYSEKIWELLCKAIDKVGKYQITGIHGDISYGTWKNYFDLSTILLFIAHGTKNTISLGKDEINWDKLEHDPPLYKRRIAIMNSCSTGSLSSGKNLFDISILHSLIQLGTGNIIAPLFPIPVLDAINFTLYYIINGVQGISHGELIRSFQVSNSRRGNYLPNMLVVYGEPSFKPFNLPINEKEKLKKSIDEVFTGLHSTSSGFIEIAPLK
ncbi:MAG: hypothetical protein ACFFD4_39785, partial [Candidatus Odinarchaeota archaeon]